MNLDELRALAKADPTLKNLRALRDAVLAAMRDLDTEANGADFTDDQQTAWDALAEERAGIDQRVIAEERAEKVREERARLRSVQVGTKETPYDGRDLRTLTPPELRSKGMALIDRPDNLRHFDTGQADKVRERVASMLGKRTKNFDGAMFARMLLVTESDAYRSAFMKLLGRTHPVLTAEEGAAVEEAAQLRAAMSLSDAAGGYGVPALIDPTIILTAQGHPNDFFAISRVEDITNDQWQGVTSAGATSYWTTEGTTVTGGEPTLAGPTVPTKKLTTYVKYSFEIGGDYPNFANEMAAVMAESDSEALVSAFTNGLGTTAQPTGVITAIEATTASQVLVTTDGSFGATDLYKLWDALPIRYRGNARWMASTSVANAVRQFAAGSSNSDANFTLNITQMSLAELFGRPFHYNDYMDDAVGTGGVTSASSITLIAVGDFRNFLIANRVGATVETVQHVLDTTTGNPTGQRGTLMWRRIGSDSINDNGFRILTQA